jgi:hypothetical protein
MLYARKQLSYSKADAVEQRDEVTSTLHITLQAHLTPARFYFTRVRAKAYLCFLRGPGGLLPGLTVQVL